MADRGIKTYDFVTKTELYFLNKMKIVQCCKNSSFSFHNSAKLFIQRVHKTGSNTQLICGLSKGYRGTKAFIIAYCLFTIFWDHNGIKNDKTHGFISLYKSNRMSVNEFVCLFPNSSETTKPDELKF